jgi:hypothetical protein
LAWDEFFYAEHVHDDGVALAGVAEQLLQLWPLGVLAPDALSVKTQSVSMCSSWRPSF